ncbi:MAG TPA: TerB family tellurite resistance protein [Marinospirillum sp.]|uniref:tellurite resistance TerB family protein n=1 Tax=Marinospirillum sp. TaxID=2183934 RepID=UPI002B494CE5|nr:TerB family tellurite resistance protein [Marinospirillum sp.]HKM15786.1 TerB family tellurite resistance protein [Marinospirillum sp.]
MLQWLKTNTAQAREKLSNEVSKFKNKEFMAAVANACALVAAADGSISSEEKVKMTEFINQSPELKAFKLTDVIAVFNDACSKFEFDVQIGQAEALKVINKIKNKEGAARLLVRVACAIGASDGDFDDDEKAVCRKICVELGLPPAEFDL